MPLRRRMPAVAIALLVTVLLAGCTTPRPTPTGTTAHTPLFASDAEALDAATKAYAAYQHKSDEIAHDGGSNPERLMPLVTTSQWSRELKGFAAFTSSHRRTKGQSTFDHSSLGRYDRSTGSIEVFLCEDVGSTRLFDASGKDVTPGERQTRIPKEVEFVPDEANGGLLISRSDVWSGDNFC